MQGEGNNPKRLPGLQVIRAMAALSVLLHHAVFYAAMSTGANIDGFMRLGLGNLGVYTFFGLSGAVMAISPANSASKFAFQRVLRIYPPYFVALGLATIIGMTVGVQSRIENIPSLMLLPTGDLNTTFFVPYWTLVYEMFFYGVLWCLIAIVPPSWRTNILLGWAGVIVAAYPFMPAFQIVMPTWWQIGISPPCLYFIGGYLTGSSIRSGNMRRVVVAALAITLIGSFGDLGTVAIYCVLSCSAIWLASAWSPGGAIKPLIWIGDRSYGLYLMHLPVCSLVLEITRGLDWSLLMVATITFVAAGAAGLTFGAIEFIAHRDWLSPLARQLAKARSSGAGTSIIHSAG